MEKILTLSKFLNQFVYQNFFLENQKLFKKCKHSAIKLLQELYSRHSLKPFSKELDFWIIKTANLKPNKSPLFEEIPFILPFEDRIAKLQLCLVEDKNSADRDDFGDLEVITIRRGCEIEDGLYEFSKLESLKDMIRIKYVNELGLEEIGIDGGGILKDYLTTCCRKAFDPNYGLFIENEDRTLTPNPDAELIHVGNQHKMMEFLGKLVGKAVYENILIEPIFSRSFLNSLLGRKNQLNDLACIDRALYKSLLFLKHSEDENIIKELGLTFSLIEIRKGKQELIELKENGSNIEVNM